MNRKLTIWVTGSSRGIGLAIAERFALDGHRVVLHCRERVSALRAQLDTLRTRGCSVMGVCGDVSSAADVSRMLSEIHAYFGPVEGLVLNAGVALPQKLLTDCTLAEISRVLEVNTLGAMLTAQAVVPDMVAKKRGSIVCISSYFGVIGGSCEVPYSASKAALGGFTRALAKELAPSGVRVNCIAPGFVPTEMNAAFDAAAQDAIRRDIPLETLGRPDDIADAAQFLLLDTARFITGQVLCVDGGSSL
ncbi:MAG: 3-oxoacyl-ACP reductase FabG [Clostridium sp.]|nr:3-oxoacyl-ACP reductase FabG [Clostridium sp.]MDD7139042.1 3-oxoacyl-ACP reductase FabG [Clostridium sp.]MDY6080789.1 3-oxoacyl-ACP reductase FabG [Eubacteriales bacterium]